MTDSHSWDPHTACVDLQHACTILSRYGLKHASKWCAEQWMGLPIQVIEQVDESLLTIDPFYLQQGVEKEPSIMYSKCLFDLGDYAHAAAVLSETSLQNKSARIEQMNPPIPNLTPLALFYRCYALYLAGEKVKEENSADQEASQKQTSRTVNPYAAQLVNELSERYETLDAFGKYVYSMVLPQEHDSNDNNSNIESSHHSYRHQRIHVLIDSIIDFPYNWSAWVDLADVIVDDRTLEGIVEDKLQPRFQEHFMYHFFCGYLFELRNQHSDAMVLYESWMSPNCFGGSPYLLRRFAISSYHTRDFESSKTILQDLHHHMPYCLDAMDVFSNILYVNQDSVCLSNLANVCVCVDKYRPETCVIVGNYYSLKQQRAKAIQYFKRALQLDRNFTSAYTLMGHEYVEWKQTGLAMESYRKAVSIDPKDYRAWYGLGQTYEILHMNLYSLHYYKTAVSLRPYDARMWCALGMAFHNIGETDNAIKSYERALQQDESEGIATEKLAGLYRKSGQTEQAASCYMRHLEIRHAATNPGVSTNGPENLEKMLQNIEIESTEADAILYLAMYYRDHAELELAGIFCSRLLDYPGPEKEHGKALLRELRSRKTTTRMIHTRSKGPVEDPFTFGS